MTTQDWTIECDLADQRKIREFDIDLDAVTVTNEDNEFRMEISDEIIPNGEFLKIVELMKNEYKAAFISSGGMLICPALEPFHRP